MPVFFCRVPALIILTISAFLLKGCSYVEYFHVKNATNSNVTLIISFKKPRPDWICEGFPGDSNSLLHCHVREMLAEKLQFEALDTFTISVNIPAHSKPYIGHSTFNPLTADSVILIKDDIREHYSFNDIYKLCKKLSYPFNRNVTYRNE